MVRDGLGQSAIYGECSAPLAVLLSVGNQARILVEAVHNGLEKTVLDVVNLHLADRLAVLVEVEPFLARNLLDPRIFLQRHKHVRLGVRKRIDALVGEHHFAEQLVVVYEVHSRGQGLVDGELVHLVHKVLDGFLYRIEFFLACNACLDELLAVCDDAILLEPGLDLLLGAVRRLVAWGMSAVSVGYDVKQGRSQLLFEQGLLAAECVDDSERVVSVHALCVPGVRLESGSDSCRIGVSHSLAPCLSAHCILVVHHVDEHRQTALHISFPEGVELVHGSEGHTFEHRSACHCTVSEVRNHDTLLAVYLLI